MAGGPAYPYMPLLTRVARPAKGNTTHVAGGSKQEYSTALGARKTLSLLSFCPLTNNPTNVKEGYGLGPVKPHCPSLEHRSGAIPARDLFPEEEQACNRLVV